MPMFLFFQKRVANNVILELGPIRMKALVILHSIGIEISRFQGDALVYAVPFWATPWCMPHTLYRPGVC